MSATGARVQVQRRTRQGWIPAAPEFTRWVDAALGRSARHWEICVLLVGARRSRALNARYRDRDRPTNVLSFPAMDRATVTAPAGAGAGAIQVRRVLGDLVICPQVLRREAHARKIRERAHWAHLVIHGVLHLVGFDHDNDADARRMERREIRVLATLGIANPYRSA